MAHGRKIPDRWIPYKACGDIIEGTRIICFKVPLYKNVQLKERNITEVWDVPAVIAEIPKLSAVIDLTNTARYYDPREFEKSNVEHRKILMPGRELPPESKVRQFMDAIDEFLGKDCESVIGVHCTHGLNRTGYMVCRYMKDRLNIPAEEAIKRFEKARGYQIERKIYLAGILGTEIPRPDFDSGWNGKRRRDKLHHRNKTRQIDKSESGDKCKSQEKNRHDDLIINDDNNSGYTYHKLTTRQKKVLKKRIQKESQQNSTVSQGNSTECQENMNKEIETNESQASLINGQYGQGSTDRSNKKRKRNKIRDKDKNKRKYEDEGKKRKESPDK